MATTDTPSPRLPQSLFRSPGFKLLLILFLTFAMAVPLFFVRLTLDEREARAGQAATDIAGGWGGTQTVAGPMLFVPYDIPAEEYMNGNRVLTTERKVAVLLPSQLALKAGAATQTRSRGIFTVPVYRSDISLQAKFDSKGLSGMIPAGGHAEWDKAYISVLISDVRGLASNVSLEANGSSLAFQPGGAESDIAATGIHAPLNLTAAPGTLTLKTQITLRGSRVLNFAPLGEQTVAHMQSQWPHPSFSGSFLPSERKVGADGFEATWNVPYLARDMAQHFDDAAAALRAVQLSNFGVRFYQPVDFYQLVERSLKYAMLFVGLTFLVFYVAELIAGRNLHAVQYTLIGSAQVLFYLLLLSFSEHIGFGLAYALAAAATVILTGLYAVSTFASRPRAAALTGVLAGLYGLLFVILEQEDFALLIGTLVLFSALGTTMFVTRKIDWFQTRNAGAAQGGEATRD